MKTANIILGSTRCVDDRQPQQQSLSTSTAEQETLTFRTSVFAHSLARIIDGRRSTRAISTSSIFRAIRSQCAVVISSLGIALPSWPINFIRVSFHEQTTISPLFPSSIFSIRKYEDRPAFKPVRYHSLLSIQTQIQN